MTTHKSLKGRVLKIAGRLDGVREEIEETIREIPEPPAEMLEHAIPYDVPAEIRGTLECVLADDVVPAAEKLRAAAQATPEQLRADWEKLSR
jgi:hypothetical protein